MIEFIDLPPSIINNIVFFLPQQELINLSLTNYKSYKPCLAKLYSKICIQTDGILNSNKGNRVNDYLDSTQTVIYGLKRVISIENQFKLIDARIKSLIWSISINHELIELVKDITIIGRFNKTVRLSLRNFLQLFQHKQLNKVFLSDYRLRKFMKKELQLIKMNSVTIDSVNEIDSLAQERELMISLVDTQKNFNSFNLIKFKSKLSSNINSLILTSDSDKYWKFIDIILDLNTKMRLNTFRILYNHGINMNKVISLLELIDFEQLTNLEILIGCNDEHCNQDCIIEFFNLIISFPNLKRLSITQNIVYPTHAMNEIFDINLINFIKSFNKLNYLSIKHSVPSNGNFNDGFEGNYLRRFKIYSNLLNSNLSTKINNLILPNLMSSFACYEQQMNNLIYNGCKCDHCAKYLAIVDELLFHHKYYNFTQNEFKDLITNQIIFTISEYLCKRIVFDDLLTDLYSLSYPFRDINWNFHNNPFSIPFRCLDKEVIDEGEYDEGEEDIYYDSASQILPCKFNESIKFKNYGVVISHFLNDLLQKITELNRGNAEDCKIGIDLNDGMNTINFRKFVVNGINYNLDKELNGTNFFSNVYDNVT